MVQLNYNPSKKNFEKKKIKVFQHLTCLLKTLSSMINILDNQDKCTFKE